jgi:hypothetical protein
MNPRLPDFGYYFFEQAFTNHLLVVRSRRTPWTVKIYIRSSWSTIALVNMPQSTSLHLGQQSP